MRLGYIVPLLLLVLLLILAGTACTMPSTTLAQAASKTAVMKPLPADAHIRRDPTTGTVVQLKATDLAVKITTAADLGERAVQVIAAYRDVFKLRDPINELHIDTVTNDQLGFTHVDLTQTYNGLIVWGAQLKAHFNANGQLYLINGRYRPTPSIDRLQPALTTDAAKARVAELLGATDECVHCSSELLIYPTEGPARLAYQIVTSAGLARSETVFIDAHNGTPLNMLSNIQTLNPSRLKIQ